ncbi:arginase [Cohaesibacter celericrescens]|uniref:Arginase n=1 Tax=Cohaesibacter celericrescens TaxID=2067669 RepID=A0A2N5XTL4_9HYPH|nr:arginase [Cohaesibacter celericrescens]PLW77852.1 arginase [Cohaesibacter celericrescens]
MVHSNTPHSSIALLGVPVQDGTHEKGCLMGPDALRTAGIVETLRGLGFSCTDHGDLSPVTTGSDSISEPKGKAINFAKIAGWTQSLSDKALDMARSSFPLFMGGDHSLSMGSVAGMARYAAEQKRDLFVLWLDAHPDFNLPKTSDSGNMHGMSVAAFCGLSELSGVYGGPLEHPVNTSHVHMMGIRSVDRQERDLLKQHHVCVNDMRILDEVGVIKPLQQLLDAVKQQDAMLHVSLDVDFLDPSIAPAVGTTVPGGATFREAHLIMELLHESGCVTSLDLVELNPFLDHRGKTAELLTDLTASLFGRKIFDRPTRRPHFRHGTD